MLLHFCLVWLFSCLLAKRLGSLHSPPFPYLEHIATACSFLSYIYIYIFLQLAGFFLSGLPKEISHLCNKLFQSCLPISVAANRQGISDVSVPLYLGSLSPSYPSCSLVKLPVDFSGLMPKAEGVFSCKAEAVYDRNVSWNLGKVAALGALVLQRKGQCTSSECIRSNKPVQLPAGLRLSTRKDLLRSRQANKWRMAKALGKGDGVWWPAPKARSSHAPWWTSLQGYDLNAKPPPLLHCLGWNSYLNPGWRASISQGRFPLRNILAFCIIRTCPCSEQRRSSSTIKLSHPSCTESIWPGPSLIRAAVIQNTFSADDLAAAFLLSRLPAQHLAIPAAAAEPILLPLKWPASSSFTPLLDFVSKQKPVRNDLTCRANELTGY